MLFVAMRCYQKYNGKHILKCVSNIATAFPNSCYYFACMSCGVVVVVVVMYVYACTPGIFYNIL